MWRAKYVGSVLIGDPEAVCEATSGHQEDGLAFAFEQGIGRDRQ